MKKLLCLCMVLVLALPLFACGEKETGGEDVTPEGLYIGFGQANITPPFGIPLGGYGQVENRLAESMFDPLYATCLAIRDGGDVYLLYNMDALRTEVDWANEIRYRLELTLDIKPANVMVMSTHSHSTPEHRSGRVKEMHWEIYMKGALEAAEAAIADLSPAKLSVGSKQVEKMNFVRHYEMNDGTYFGSNFGSTASGFKGHATIGDHELTADELKATFPAPEGDKGEYYAEIYADAAKKQFCYSIPYTETKYEYYYTSADDAGYDYVKLDCGYQSISDIKEKIEEVYSLDYTNSIYGTLFDGVVSGNVVMTARYIETTASNGAMMLAQSNNYDPMKVEKRVYLFETAKINALSSSKNLVRISIDTYLPSAPDKIVTREITLVYQRGNWFLNNPTF